MLCGHGEERWLCARGSLRSQPQGCSRGGKLNRAGVWDELCLAGWGIQFSPRFLVLFWPVPLSWQRVGTFRGGLREGICTYRRMGVNRVVPLLGGVDVATKARFYLMPGKTHLIFPVWIDSHIFLLRSIFDSIAGSWMGNHQTLFPSFLAAYVTFCLSLFSALQSSCPEASGCTGQ